MTAYQSVEAHYYRAARRRDSSLSSRATRRARMSGVRTHFVTKLLEILPVRYVAHSRTARTTGRIARVPGPSRSLLWVIGVQQ